LAVDLKEFGIIVVSINPGWTDTDMGKASGRTPSVSATDATNQMLTTLCRLTIDESGGFFAKDGTTIPY
jgi:NAD(P)-dependent dehydrogenase (short-subunit alcohol dehydrogenase family)